MIFKFPDFFADILFTLNIVPLQTEGKVSEHIFVHCFELHSIERKPMLVQKPGGKKYGFVIQNGLVFEVHIKIIKIPNKTNRNVFI